MGEIGSGLPKFPKSEIRTEHSVSSNFPTEFDPTLTRTERIGAVSSRFRGSFIVDVARLHRRRPVLSSSSSSKWRGSSKRGSDEEEEERGVARIVEDLVVDRRCTRRCSDRDRER